MNHKLIFKTALLAGEIMLRNGAETYRVEDTINRILRTTNYNVTDSFVTPTGIFATLDDSSIEMITMVRRVEYRTIHLHKVALTNNVSRLYVEGKIDIEEAYNRLLSIKDEPPYGIALMLVAYGLTAGFFTIVFGGNIRDFLVSTIIGFLIGLLQHHLLKKHVSKFLIDIFGGAIIAILAVVFTIYVPLGNHLGYIIVGSIMPLVPGLAITNAIRDTIQGDLVSGISRGVEAFFVAISIAVGVGTVLKLYYIYSGGGILL